MSVDVIIVGAGLAGLAAAVRLHAGAREVLVLEASDGVGGRVRTDLVDGYRLDRGFQVHNTAYPEARRVLDHDALDLRSFTPGAIVHHEGRNLRIADPRRVPTAALRTASSPLLPIADKARIAAFSAWCGYAPVGRLTAGADSSTEEALRGFGIGPAGMERFLRPFLAGVLCEPGLATSARYTRLVWRTFVRGDSAVPAAGMQAIPDQLARRLPTGAVRLNTAVTEVTERGVRTGDGEVITAPTVVVATDGDAAAALLPGLSAPDWHGVTTIYHATSAIPEPEAILYLDADRPDLALNTIAVSAAAPAYATGGRTLLATSVLGERRTDPDLPALVTARLAALFELSTADLDEVGRYDIDQALPAMPPPLQLRKPVRLGPGRFACGDWRDTSSIQGALVSGRRTAETILAGR